VITTNDEEFHLWCKLEMVISSGGILHHRKERFVVITRQLQAAEVLSKQSTMNDKSSFIKVPLVITKQLVITNQLKLYFNNSSRIPTHVPSREKNTFSP
jgi:hypothetical protein